MKRLSLILCLGVLIAGALAACGAEEDPEFVYDSNSFFPEDYKTSYSKLSKYDCTKSADHGNDYVKVWVSPEIKPAYDQKGTAAPEGSVVLKEQFLDDECTDFNRITVMKRDSSSANGWQWQRIFENGEVEFTVEDNFCVSCHAALPSCVDSICSY